MTDVNDYIFDADQTSFQQLVLDNSEKGPVLVHFWSPKAGPSLRFFPLLEKQVEHYQGSFLLVNVDVDEQKNIIRDYAITSVPTSKLFVQRQVRETLFGYQNEQDLQFMLDQYVASENDVIIHQSLMLFEQGQHEDAYQQLGQAALNSPHYYKLPLTIASLMQTEGRIADALRLLKSLPQSMQQKPACRRLIIECEFAEMASPVQQPEQLIAFVADNRHELPAVALLAAWHVTQRQFESALDLFSHIMQQNPRYEDDLGRRCIIKILHLLDEQDPLIKSFRDVIRTQDH